mmetsp:Transcript_156765/g.500238  ORF Transcript_156765/g.500238 Transcript_156765/m.500238 type:complete len:212 (+) Transcript_156765:508-1143(+)
MREAIANLSKALDVPIIRGRDQSRRLIQNEGRRCREQLADLRSRDTVRRFNWFGRLRSNGQRGRRNQCLHPQDQTRKQRRLQSNEFQQLASNRGLGATQRVRRGAHVEVALKFQVLHLASGITPRAGTAKHTTSRQRRRAWTIYGRVDRLGTSVAQRRRGRRPRDLDKQKLEHCVQLAQHRVGRHHEQIIRTLRGHIRAHNATNGSMRDRS